MFQIFIDFLNCIIVECFKDTVQLATAGTINTILEALNVLISSEFLSLARLENIIPSLANSQQLLSGILFLLNIYFIYIFLDVLPKLSNENQLKKAVKALKYLQDLNSSSLYIH